MCVLFICAAEDVDLKLVHPSMGALLAWRYAQLLTVLPRRATGALVCLNLFAGGATAANVRCCRGSRMGAAGVGTPSSAAHGWLPSKPA